ncbi:retrovirus-related pol polyprotein from transposon TNT 1-94 [Tanacetum coccineum]
MKDKLTLLEAIPLTSQSLKSIQSKNKFIVAETFDWDEEEVSDDEEETQVKVLMDLADDELSVGKNHERNDEWIDITMKKVNILVSMDEDSDWQTYLKYINIDLKYIEEQILNLLSKYNKIVFELNKCRNDLLVLKQAKLQAFTFHIQNTKLTKSNHALQDQLKEERKGASPSSKVMTLTYKDHSLKERSGLGTMKHTKPETQESLNKSVSGCVTVFDTEPSESSKPVNSSKQSQESKPNGKNPNSSKLVRPKPLQKPKLKCEHCNYTNHSTDDCYRILYCMKCKKEDHRTSDHDIYDNFTSGNNHVILVRGGVLVESSQSSESFIGVSCTTCGSSVHLTSNHNDFKHFKRGEKLHATKAKEPTKNGCSKSMTGVKSYLHKYVEQPGPKVVFGDNSSCITQGYGSINCGGIIFSKFDDKQGTISNANKEIVLIAPRRNDVYVHDMSSLTPNGACFFAKASESVHKTLVDEIRIDDSSRYPPNEFLHEDDPSRPYQVNFEFLYYIIPHGCSLTKLTQENHVLEVIAPNEQDIPHTEDVEDTNHASTSSYLVAQDRWSRDHHIDLVNIIGDLGEVKLIRSMASKLTATSASECLFADFFSKIEPKKVQEEGIEYDETFAPVARMKAIRIFLYFSKYMNFIVFQMDVKSAFLNGKLKEEVYVKQLHRLESSEFPDYVCKFDKALYGLKQAPKAWHETLSTFLIQNNSSVKTTMVPSNNLRHDLTSKLISDQSKRITSHCCEKNLQVPERDHILKGDIELHFIPTEYQLANIFTKPLDEPTFTRLKAEEFWCTAIAYDPTPPADDSKERPLKEYKIKFTMMNGKNSLTLDFKTFIKATSLDYNQGTYVSHPSPEVVKAEFAKIATDEVLNGNYQPQKQRKQSEPKKTPVVQATKTPPTEEVPTEDSDKTQLVSLGQTAHPQDTERNIQLSVKGFHSLPDEGTRKSQPFSEDKTIDPKDSEGNKHPADKGLPSTVPDESMGKTKPLPRGPWTDAEYQVDLGVDQTQSTRFKISVPDQHQSKTSSEVKLDFEPFKLTTIDDIQALLEATDDDLKEDNEDDVDRPESSKAKKTESSDSESSSCSESLKPYDNYMPITERQLEKHEKVAASYADLKWSLEDFINTSFTKYENTDAALMNFQQILNIFKTDHNTCLRRILENLKEVQDAVKEDHALNKKVLEAFKSYTNNSTNLTELLTPVKTFNFFGLKSLVESLKAVVDAQNDHLAKNFAHTATEEPPSHTKGEKADMDIEEAVEKQPINEPEVEKSVQEPVRASRAIPISVVKPLMRPAPELEMMSSSSRIQLTNIILEVLIPQPTGSVINITPHEQPKSPPIAPKAGRRRGIVTDDVESPKKLVKASSKVRHDPDEPVRVPYEIYGKLYHLTNDEIQPYLDKEEKMKRAAEEAKVKKAIKLINKRLDQYMWTTTSRLKPEPISDVKIYPNTKPVVITVYRGTNRRNFEVYNPFKFGDFGVIELDGSYHSEKEEQDSLPAPAPEQASSQLSGRKRKIMGLEPEIHIPGLECNRSLPENVLFINNIVIEEPEYGMFFIDIFGDEAFQRMNGIHKVDMETLLTYLVMASNITTPYNIRFCLKLNKLIENNLDQDKLKSKKVKLEYVGYKLD